ncbi:MAG: hypothetical protein ACJ74W_23015 [Pyrinomonadaceae bacterium]
MSGFLSNLVLRQLESGEVVQPRLTSRFEPPPAQPFAARAHSSDTDELGKPGASAALELESELSTDRLSVTFTPRQVTPGHAASSDTPRQDDAQTHRPAGTSDEYVAAQSDPTAGRGQTQSSVYAPPPNVRAHPIQRLAAQMETPAATLQPAPPLCVQSTGPDPLQHARAAQQMQFDTGTSGPTSATHGARADAIKPAREGEDRQHNSLRQPDASRATARGSALVPQPSALIPSERHEDEGGAASAVHVVRAVTIEPAHDGEDSRHSPPPKPETSRPRTQGTAFVPQLSVLVPAEPREDSRHARVLKQTVNDKSSAEVESPERADALSTVRRMNFAARQSVAEALSAAEHRPGRATAATPPPAHAQSPHVLAQPHDVRRVESRAVHSEPGAAHESAPIINVTIGRVEVRANNVPAAPRRQDANAPHMSLDDYLRQRGGGGSR